MLAHTAVAVPSQTDKAGDWPPLLTLMSNNSSVEQLQSDIAEWFRENQPDAYDLAGPANRMSTESGLRSTQGASTPGMLPFLLNT